MLASCGARGQAGRGWRAAGAARAVPPPPAAEIRKQEWHKRVRDDLRPARRRRHSMVSLWPGKSRRATTHFALARAPTSCSHSTWARQRVNILLERTIAPCPNMSPKMTITPPPTATTSTTTIMILTSLLLALIISSQHFVGAQLDHLTITQDQPPQPIAQQSPPQQSQPSTRQPQQEILVQPNSPVRIECKLPKVVASGSRKFYWNFQRSSLQDNKPDLLCFQTQCIDEAAYGIQLEVDQSLGVYDLLINNATYELNDGIYYCDYKDTSPDSRATINREFRLTVLSK